MVLARKYACQKLAIIKITLNFNRLLQSHYFTVLVPLVSFTSWLNVEVINLCVRHVHTC